MRDASRAAHIAGISGVNVAEVDLASVEAEGAFGQVLENASADFVINTAAVFKRGCADPEKELVSCPAS